MGYGGFPPALMLRIPVIISVSWEYPRSGPSARQENVGVVHFFLSVMTSSVSTSSWLFTLSIN